MYQALYRKYRPKSFDDVVGQDVIIRTIENSIIHDRISHAYLFTGPRGCGKTTVAKILARTVNCKNLNGIKACDECVCCTQNINENMDIIEIDAASNNGVDEIRDINSKVNLAPSLGKYKIYIIDEVHMLTIGAFNALLKTLEEPPHHVIFILATTDPQKVPVTILSRCQRFDFKKISIDKIKNRLRNISQLENVKIDELALEEIAYLGDGSLRDALSIFDQVIAYANEEITVEDIHDVNGTVSNLEIQQLIKNMCNKKLPEVMRCFDNYNSNGKSMVKITELIILYLRNLLLFHLNSLEENQELYEPLQDMMDNNQILNCISILNQTLLDMKKFSNPKMLLELAFIKLMNFEQNIQNKPKMEIENKINDNKTSKLVVEEKIKSKTNVEKAVENKGQNISREIQIDENVLREIKEFIYIRICNTLSQFSKKNTLELKSQLERASEYLLDEKYNACASILLDGKLKAASEEYLVFSYQTEHLSYQFNQNINKLEELIEKIFSKKYKIIATDDENWDEIKNRFNKKQDKFEYQEENLNIDDIMKKILKNSDDNLKSLFGEIVEYN